MSSGNGVGGDDLVLAHELPKGSAIFAGGSGGGADVAMMNGQHLTDVLGLELGDGVRLLDLEGGLFLAMLRLGHADVFSDYERAFRKHEGSLDNILQLPDVARPAITQEFLQRLGGELLFRYSVFVGVFGNKMAGQQR